MEDPGSQSIAVELLLLLLFISLSAFFTMVETALQTISPSRVEQKAEEGEKAYQRLLTVLNHPDNFLTTVQIAITLINIVIGVRLASNLGELIASYFSGSTLANTLAIGIAIILLTIITLVLGDLYPKRVAKHFGEGFVLKVLFLIIVISRVSQPFVWVINGLTNVVSRLTPVKWDDNDEKMTRDEIEYMLTNSEETLDADEIEMLQGIFSLDEIMAREVMVARTDAFMVDINDSKEVIIDKILKHNFSRIPVYQGNVDRIIGIIHTKNLLKAAYTRGFEQLNLRKILQEPLFVPETIFIDDLIKALRKTQNQMAILLDEYGGVSGLVTLEDLVEEIVGDIDDESDKAEVEVREIAEDTYIILGTMTLNDFNEHFETNLENEDVDTIAGYYITTVGSIPHQEVKETIAIESNDKLLMIVNDKVKDGRIIKLKLTITEQKNKG